VAEVAVRERLRPGADEALVIEQTRARQGLDRLIARLGRDPSLRQALGELPAREVAVAQRLSCHAQHFRPPELTCERARPLSIEREAGVQSRANDRICGKDAPLLSVERDRDPAVPPLAERRDGRSHDQEAFAETFFSSSSAASGGGASTSVSVGSNRADTTWSGPASACSWARMA